MRVGFTPDGTLRALSGATALHTLEGHTSTVFGVAAFTLPDGTPRALSGSADKTVRVRDPVAGQGAAHA